MVLLGVAGCGSGGDDAPAVTAPPGSAIIGQSGGRVSLDDGTEVVFPPKALGSDVRVAITKDSTGAPPLPPSAEAAGAVYTITPHGGRFDAHVEVAIPVERVLGAVNEQLLLVTAQPGDTQWTVLSGARYSNGKLRAPVMHFSYFRAIVLVDVVAPTLTSTINDGYLFEPIHMPRTNNVGGPGINAISADLEFSERNSGESVLGMFSAASMWSQMVLEARLTYPPSAVRSGSRFANAAAARACRPVSMGHDGAQWRVLREGAPTPLTGVWHHPPRQRDASTYPGNPSRKTRPFSVFEGTEPRPQDLFDRESKTGFGAVHFFGDSVLPSRGDFTPAGSLDPWATPPQGNTVDDDTYIWNGSMSFEPAVHNGRVQIETRVPTDCNLTVQAVPIAFRLNLAVDASGRLANPAYLGVMPEADVVAVGNGDTAVMPFLEVNADSSFSIRWEFSTDPVIWQGLPVPPERIQRGADRQGGSFGSSAFGLERPYSIVINNAQLRDAGYYRAWTCAKPAGTFCFSNAPIQLAVHTAPPSIALQPLPQTVAVGQTATFTARGLPSGPVGWVANSVSVPSVQWQRRSVVEAAFNIGGWTNIPGATNTDASNPWRTTYTTPATTAADHGYLYRALFTTAVGTTATEPAVLVVVASQAAQAPIVTGQPASQNVVVGSTATFVVTVTGTQPMNYQWRRNGASIPGANSATLTLPNVSAQDDANYDIVITNQAGSVTSSAARLTVSPAPGQPLPPQILAAPASISVAAGNAANFAVAVSGTGPLTYQWLKNGVAIAGGTSAAFTLSPVALADAGSYAVRVTNAQGSVTSAAAILTVTAPQAVVTAPTIAMQPISLAVPPGAGATLAVAVTGTAPFTYQWLRNGQPVAGATGPMLHFSATTALDGGQYMVVVTNAAGSASSSPAQLTISGAPVISGQPLSATAVEGTSATFNVTAAGDALRYQWQRDGVAINGASASSYTTPPLMLADTGARFSVIVYNAAGVVVSNSAVLTVTPPPVAAGWTTPTLVGAGQVAEPAAGMDSSRNAFALWPSIEDTRYRLRAARGGMGGTWQPAQLIDVDLPENAESYDPQIAVAADGRAMAVWGFGLRGTTQYHVAAARFDGATWGPAERISTQFDGQSTGFRVGMDASGRAVAVYRQFNGTRRAIYGRIHNGSGWSAPLLIDGGSNSGDPALALDALGQGWVVITAAMEVKAVSVNLAAGTFGEPVKLSDANSARDPAVALDASGAAVAAWVASGQTFADLVTARYANGSWQAAQTIDVGLGQPDYGVAMTGSGEAHVAYIKRDATDLETAYSRRFVPGGGWQAIERRSGEGAGRVQRIQLAASSAGRVILNWVQVGPATNNYNAWAQVWGSGTWSAPVRVQGPTNPISNISLPLGTRSLTVGPDSTGLLLWLEYSGDIGQIMAAFYP